MNSTYKKDTNSSPPQNCVSGWQVDFAIERERWEKGGKREKEGKGREKERECVFVYERERERSLDLCLFCEGSWYVAVHI
mmetsp:Transcript_63619/g.102885  ORF Transcript_63619/g.102885 Transcript_63619/m.102885 type:complete len:80 (+) Transcript_63619:723-962(+)